MNKLSLTLTLIAFLTAGAIAGPEDAPTMENPLTEMKIGERMYTKVYLESFSEETGFAMVGHQWGAKKVKVEDLSDEHKKLLGINTSLTEEEIAANRSLKSKERAAYLAKEDKALAEAEAQAKLNKPVTTSSSSSTGRQIDKSKYPKAFHALIDKAEKQAASTGGKIKISISGSG